MEKQSRGSVAERRRSKEDKKKEERTRGKSHRTKMGLNQFHIVKSDLN